MLQSKLKVEIFCLLDQSNIHHRARRRRAVSELACWRLETVQSRQVSLTSDTTMTCNLPLPTTLQTVTKHVYDKNHYYCLTAIFCDHYGLHLKASPQET